MDLLTWVLLVATGVFLVAFGGLIASLMNRRSLQLIGMDIAQIKQDAAHAKANARATKQAMEHFAAKAAEHRAESKAEHIAASEERQNGESG